MSKLFKITLFIFLVFAVCHVHAQSFKEIKKDMAEKKKKQKMADKTYGKKAKELKKEGYKVYASTKTLSETLMAHDYKLKPITGESRYEKEIVVTVLNCPNINLCVRKGLADAATHYAQLTNSFVKGKVLSEGKLDGNPNGKKPNKEAIDKFGQAFEQQVSAQVSNILENSYALISEKGNGYKYEVHYIVEKEVAKKARQLAYQRTLTALAQSQAETDANLDWMQSVSDFVNDAPEPKK